MTLLVNLPPELISAILGFLPLKALGYFMQTCCRARGDVLFGRIKPNYSAAITPEFCRDIIKLTWRPEYVHLLYKIISPGLVESLIGREEYSAIIENLLAPSLAYEKSRIKQPASRGKDYRLDILNWLKDNGFPILFNPDIISDMIDIDMIGWISMHCPNGHNKEMIKKCIKTGFAFALNNFYNKSARFIFPRNWAELADCDMSAKSLRWFSDHGFVPDVLSAHYRSDAVLLSIMGALYNNNVKALQWWLERDFNKNCPIRIAALYFNNKQVHIIHLWLKTNLLGNEPGLDRLSKAQRLYLDILRRHFKPVIEDECCIRSLVREGCLDSLEMIMGGVSNLAHVYNSYMRYSFEFGHVHFLNYLYNKKGLEFKGEKYVLGLAVKNGHVQALKWWQSIGGQLAIEPSSIHAALIRSRTAMLDFLLQNGLISRADTHLYIAAIEANQVKAMEWIERNGISIDVSSAYLYRLVVKGRFRMLRRLHEKGLMKKLSEEEVSWLRDKIAFEYLGRSWREPIDGEILNWLIGQRSVFAEGQRSVFVEGQRSVFAEAHDYLDASSISWGQGARGLKKMK